MTSYSETQNPNFEIPDLSQLQPPNPKPFSNKELQAISNIFHSVTTTNYIPVKNLGTTLRLCNLHPTEAEIERLMSRLGKEFSLGDLIDLVAECKMKEISDWELVCLRFFHRRDRFGDGRIRIREMRHWLCQEGEVSERVLERVFEDLMKRVGLEKQDTIALEEFMLICTMVAKYS